MARSELSPVPRCSAARSGPLPLRKRTEQGHLRWREARSMRRYAPCRLTARSHLASPGHHENADFRQGSPHADVLGTREMPFPQRSRAAVLVAQLLLQRLAHQTHDVPHVVH